MPSPDPDARVAGIGIERLRARGVRVDVGCDAAGAILDNHGYYHDRLGVPRTVTLKMATSRDGKVARARGQRDRVTGDAAQLDAHRLRAVNDAVVIGAETARIDRPRLDCRLLEAGVDREPAIVVFNTSLSLANDAAWPAHDRDFIVVCAADANAARASALEKRGARVIRCGLRDGLVDVSEAVTTLASLGFSRVLVEGGPRLLQSFIDAGEWDAFWHYQSNEIFGRDGVPGVTLEGAVADEAPLGDDTRRRHISAGSWDRLTRALGARVLSAAERMHDVHGHR
jgi:diaminohydroxyphosphoribosylaminopyrimidine deaminase/5-amino-6-(5-phosphoribosylamino)uracil reductase